MLVDMEKRCGLKIQKPHLGNLKEGWLVFQGFTQKRDYVIHGFYSILIKATICPVAAVIQIGVVFTRINFIFHRLLTRA